MKVIKIAICDDLDIVTEELKSIVTEILSRHKYEAECKTFLSAEDMLKEIEDFSIVFMAPTDKYEMISLLIYPLAIVCFYIAQVCDGIKRISRVIIVAFLTEALGLMIVWVGRTVMESDDQLNPIINKGIIVNLLIVFFTVIINYIIRRLSAEQNQKIKSFISRHLIVPVILMSLVLLFTTAGLDMARDNFKSILFRNIAGICFGAGLVTQCIKVVACEIAGYDGPGSSFSW